jgi:hypothetical protein
VDIDELLEPLQSKYDVSMTWHNGGWVVRFIRWGPESLHVTAESVSLPEAAHQAIEKLPTL